MNNGLIHAVNEVATDLETLPQEASADATPGRTAATTQIRGSLLLLIGRVLSLGLNFAIQVLTVRYLSKTEYGSWAYALAVVTLGTHLVVLGLDKTLTRFVPIYQEKLDYPKMYGTIVMMVGTVACLGLALVLAVLGMSHVIGPYLGADPLSRQLVLILILLAPVQALDSLLVGLLAVFAPPSAIFFRKHVLAPGLKLLAVMLLIFYQSTVFVLAMGYLAAAVFGVGLYTVMLGRVLHVAGLLRHFRVRALDFPAREVFSFSLPLLSSDLVFLLRGSLIVLLLEHLWNSTAVADYRAVFPVARLNQVVFDSFHLLFMPSAARLFARNDREGINGLYWGTALWIAVFSFPIFAVSFALAKPAAVLLFSERYAESGTILAILSLGFYFNAATGFNGLTLRVFGRVRYIVIVDLVAGAISVALSLALVPMYGAVGGAIATCATLVVHNILNQAGLRGSGIQLFQWRYAKAYLVIALAAVGLLLVQVLASPPTIVAFGLAAVVSMAVIAINRDQLDVQNTFPELRRVRWLRPLFETSGKAA
jgi:O-antigen/teichoic acid export membrane protein